MAFPPDPVWITLAHRCRQEGLPNPSSKSLEIHILALHTLGKCIKRLHSR